MRARLLAATLECCNEQVNFRLPSADEVCAQASVSRATFYKYFDSVQDAVDALGQSLLDEMITDLSTLIEETSALDRIGIGLQVFVMRSALDPSWAAFVSRVSLAQPDSEFARVAARDFEAAAEAGQIRVSSIEAAHSLALGAVFEAIRYVHATGERSRDYAEGLAVMVLKALDVDETEAKRTVTKASDRIRELGPRYFEWWADPWS